MTTLVQLLSHLYGILLRLYPPSFRAEFGAEMRDVLAEAMAEAAARGWGPLVGLFLRELRDWPGALVRAHWHTLRKESMMSENMNDRVVSSGDASTWEDQHPPVPWREALLAGLPHALVALTYHAAQAMGAYGLLTLDRGTIYTAAGALLALSTGAALVIAWRRGWPRWSASWIVYAFLTVAIPLGTALEGLGRSLSSWRLMFLLPQVYSSLLLPFALVAIILVLVLHHRLKFLLALLPLLPLLWNFALEFAYPTRTVAELVGWLSTAGIAVLIARAGSVRRGVWMTLGLSLGVGLLYTYVGTYHAHYPPGAPTQYQSPPTLLDWWNPLALGTLISAVLILEPLLLRRLRLLGQRSGTLGRLGFSASLVGIILLLATNVTASWWFGSGFLFIIRTWGYQAAKGPYLSVLAYGAVFLCLAGAVSFGAALLRYEPSIEEGASLFLAFFLVVMPLTLALPIAYRTWDVRTIPKIWGYVLGLPWLALGIWLVTRRGAGRISGATA